MQGRLVFLTWFKHPRNPATTVSGCRPNNGNTVCLVLSCPFFAYCQRGGNVILSSIQAWICWEWRGKRGEKNLRPMDSYFLVWSSCSSPMWDSCQCAAQQSGWTWRKLSFFSVPAPGLKYWIIDSLFMYQDRKRNERKNPSSGQWIRRQSTQFILDRSQRKKLLKSYSSRTKIRPSQPHSISTRVLNFHQKSRQSGYLRKLVFPVLEGLN